MTSNAEFATPSGDVWIGLGEQKLPADTAASWVVTPACGAVSTFIGVIRDHSEGREGVTHIDYEAYPKYAERSLSEVADIAFATWPQLGRIAILHRVGHVPLSEAAVLVSVSAAHRREAISAMTFCIDVLKECAPIWKIEYAGRDRAWPDNGTTILETSDAARAWFDANPGLLPNTVAP